MTRYPDTLVREVMRENAPKLLAIVAQIQQATSTIDMTKTVNTEREAAKVSPTLPDRKAA